MQPLQIVKLTTNGGLPYVRETHGQRAITLATIANVVNEISAGTCGGLYQPITDRQSYDSCYNSVARLFTCGNLEHCSKCMGWNLLTQALSDHLGIAQGLVEPDTYILCVVCATTSDAH